MSHDEVDAPEEVEVESEGLENDPIAILEEQVQELMSDLQYSRAETMNARQRGQRDKSEAIKFGATNLATRILPAIDSLEKALLNGNGDSESILEGVRMTLSALNSALEAEGISKVESKGIEFDPTRMEAVATVPAPEGEKSGTVIEEIEAGYMHHDRVLRPAKVIVAS
ncbi:MAG: nucleotide exchange factor GrpE [Candidatus Thalassarchaeaceae archaeon]|nr:nucleotide exchange factor GrpE [Candidatus Thalassarchaeaceae archaeon]